MNILEKVLGMCGLNSQTSQEVIGVLEWVEQQGGLHAIVSHIQNGDFNAVVNSWLGNEKNIVVSSDIVEKMIHSEAIRQLTERMGINTQDTLNLLVKYLPQLVDKASFAGSLEKNADLIALASQLMH